MRPVMGAPDDTPQIHGLVDQVEHLSKTLIERNAEIKKLREALQKIPHLHTLHEAVKLSEEVLKEG